MRFEDLDTCIGAFYCDATGYDSVGKKLVDQSGYGNDLTMVSGVAPVYATRDGYQVMDFDMTYYFEGPNLLKSGGSCVFVGVCDQSGADGSQLIVNTLSRKANAGNFDGSPNDAAHADWFASVYGRKTIYFNSNGPVLFDQNGGTNAAGSNFTAGQMNLFVGAVSDYPAQIQAATGTAARTTTNYGAGSSAALAGSHMRIGDLKASGSLTVGKYLSAKRIYFFTGNVFDHADFATARAAEIAAWGI